MFLPCRPCCGGGGGGDPCSGEYPDSVEIDIDYIGFKTNTSLSFPSMGTGLNSATTWYDTLQLAVHPIGGTQTIYASVANYAILNHLDGTFVLTQGVGGVYTYTDPEGFSLQLVMDQPSNYRLTMTINGGPEVRTCHRYSATPATQANMSAASWNSGMTDCLPVLQTSTTAYHIFYGPQHRQIPYTGSDTYSWIGPAWTLGSSVNCENRTGAWPSATASETCPGPSVSETCSFYADFDQCTVSGPSFSVGSGTATGGLDFTSGIYFDAAVPVNWTPHATTLSYHQGNPYYPTTGAPEVWTDGSGQQWVVTYGSAGPLGVGLNGSSKANHIATRHQVTRIQGIYGGVPVDLFSRA